MCVYVCVRVCVWGGGYVGEEKLKILECLHIVYGFLYTQQQHNLCYGAWPLTALSGPPHAERKVVSKKRVEHQADSLLEGRHLRAEDAYQSEQKGGKPLECACNFAKLDLGIAFQVFLRVTSHAIANWCLGFLLFAVCCC